MVNSRFMSFLQAVERKVNAVPIRRMWALLIDNMYFMIINAMRYEYLKGPRIIPWGSESLADHFPFVIRSGIFFSYDYALHIMTLYGFMLWSIYIIVTSYYYKGTPGMLQMELRFRDKNGGNRPNLYQMVARHFATYISALPLFLGYVWMFFDKKHRTWHDMISGVIIVDKSE